MEHWATLHWNAHQLTRALHFALRSRGSSEELPAGATYARVSKTHHRAPRVCCALVALLAEPTAWLQWSGSFRKGQATHMQGLGCWGGSWSASMAQADARTSAAALLGSSPLRGGVRGGGQRARSREGEAEPRG